MLKEQFLSSTPDRVLTKARKLRRKFPNLTLVESISIVHWVGSDYSNINGYLLGLNNSDSPEYWKKVVSYLLSAMEKNKILKFSRENFISIAQDYFSEYSKKIIINNLSNDGLLNRGVEFEDEIKEKNYLKRYKIGEVTTETTFIATSAFSPGFNAFNGDCGITFLIKPKDRNTKGYLVDQYKNGLLEGEVLFPPNSKFKVTNIDKYSNTKYSYEEIMDFSVMTQLKNKYPCKNKNLYKAVIYILKDLGFYSESPFAEVNQKIEKKFPGLYLFLRKLEDKFPPDLKYQLFHTYDNGIELTKTVIHMEEI